jgi:uncharacterized tellurite resistance protein B-like protein
MLLAEPILFNYVIVRVWKIRCADCGCLSSECEVALRLANVLIVRRENI